MLVNATSIMLVNGMFILCSGPESPLKIVLECVPKVALLIGRMQSTSARPILSKFLGKIHRLLPCLCDLCVRIWRSFLPRPRNKDGETVGPISVFEIIRSGLVSLWVIITSRFCLCGNETSRVEGRRGEASEYYYEKATDSTAHFGN